MFRLQKYDREQSMSQNCTIQMLMDQQNIIHKQRETIEKKKHQLTKVKQKHTKTTEELEKKPETTKQTEETKKVSKSFALCKDKTFDLNNPTNYNRHFKKCKVVQEKKNAKEEKQFEKQKVKMYIFSTEYIFLKPKDQTNEHEQKNK